MSALILSVLTILQRVGSFGASIFVVTKIQLRAEWATFLRPYYIYSSLNPNQIRVLKVCPPRTALQFEPVQCTLEHVSLTDHTETYRQWEESSGQNSELRPLMARKAWIEHIESKKLGGDEPHNQTALRFTWGDYLAVSYCWGWDAEAPSCRIILDGQLIPVTESLAAALRASRTLSANSASSSTVRIWADALCINQGDQEERAEGVLCMNSIYGNASNVLVHIGPKADDSDRALDMLHKIGKDLEAGIDCEAALRQVKWSHTADDVKILSAVVQFLCRPYWRRLWILQELAMSSEEVSVGCGDHLVPLKYVASATQLLCVNAETVLTVLGVENIDVDNMLACMWVIMYVDQIRVQVRRLEDQRDKNVAYLDLQMPLVILGQNAQAKEEVDKVYGLLGLMPKAIRTKMISYVDYELPSEMVFTALSRAIIESTGTLDAIYAKSYQQTISPSWTIDWRLPFGRAALFGDYQFYCYNNYEGAYSDLRSMVDKYRKVRADAGRAPTIEFADQSLLKCSGFLIGTLDGIASRVAVEPPPRVEHLQPLFLGNPYGDEAATRNALLHTFFVNPLWSELEEAALFHIPWLAGDSYSLGPDGSFPVDDFPTLLRQMWDCGWESSIGGNFITFEAQRRWLGHFRIGGKPLHEYFDRGIVQCAFPKQRVDLDIAMMIGAHVGRRLVTLDTGHFGLAPETVTRGDGVYVIVGCAAPVVLRPVPNSSHFEVVGECYVEGFAKGEGMAGLDAGEYKLEDITLC